MATKNRISLKAFFKRWRKPKEVDFSDLIDSTYNKVDDANMSVTTLTAEGNITTDGHIIVDGYASANQVLCNEVYATNRVISNITNNGIDTQSGLFVASGFYVGSFGTGRWRLGDPFDGDFLDNGIDMLQVNGSVKCSGFRPGIKMIYNEASQPYVTEFDDCTLFCGSTTGVNLFLNSDLPDGTEHTIGLLGGPGVSINANGGTIQGAGGPIVITDTKVTYTFHLYNPTGSEQQWFVKQKTDWN